MRETRSGNMDRAQYCICLCLGRNGLDRVKALLRPMVREAALHPWSITRYPPVPKPEAVARILAPRDLATGRQYMMQGRIGTTEWLRYLLA